MLFTGEKGKLFSPLLLYTMTSEQNEALLEIYEELKRGTEKVNRVVEIFNDYFGEDKVDFKINSSCKDFIATINTYNPYAENLSEWKEAVKDLYHSTYEILIYFPEITITNEHDRSAVLKDLYAKIIIDKNGRISSRHIYLNRSTYTIKEFLSDYMHSHCPGIPKITMEDGYLKFGKMCLGYGPINETLESLSRAFDEDRWNLFCWELDKVIRVESLVGVPYRKLENVGNGTENRIRIYEAPDMNFNRKIPLQENYIASFIEYAIKSNKLKFVYAFNSYTLGMSYKDYIVTISNLFISWYNNLPEEDKAVIYVPAIIKKKAFIVTSFNIYKDTSYSHRGIEDLIDAKVCHFKGKDIYVSIIDKDNTLDNYSSLMDKTPANNILNSILITINYGYQNSSFDPSTPVYVL